MEQSRENFSSFSDAAAESEQRKKSDKEIIDRDEIGIVADITRFGIMVDKVTGHYDEAEKKLHQYMADGQAEAVELNTQYSRLKAEMTQANNDFKEYATAHEGLVNDQTPGWRQLKSRVETAVRNLEEFQTTKLGMTFEEESQIA